VYKLAVTLRASIDEKNCQSSCPYGQWFKLGFKNGADYWGSTHNTPAPGTARDFADYVWLPPGGATSNDIMDLLIEPDSAGGVALEDYLAVPMLTHYRVSDKTVYDGSGHSYTTTYTYSGAAANEPGPVEEGGTSIGALTAYPYVEPYSEFRGHRQVTEIGPEGRKTVTLYHQDDLYKGRPEKVTVYDESDTGSFKVSETVYSYGSTTIAVNSAALPKAYPRDDPDGNQATATAAPPGRPAATTPMTAMAT
jgi:hypothetical protein